MDEILDCPSGHFYRVARKEDGKLTWMCDRCGMTVGGILTIGPQGMDAE